MKSTLNNLEIWKVLTEYLYEERSLLEINQFMFELKSPSSVFYILKKRENISLLISKYKPNVKVFKSPNETPQNNIFNFEQISETKIEEEQTGTNSLVLCILQKLINIQKLLLVSPTFVLNFINEALDSFGFSDQLLNLFFLEYNRDYFLSFYTQKHKIKFKNSASHINNFFGVFGCKWSTNENDSIFMLHGPFVQPNQQTQHDQTKIRGFDDLLVKNNLLHTHSLGLYEEKKANQFLPLAGTQSFSKDSQLRRHLSKISQIINRVASFLMLREINQLVRLNKHYFTLFGYLTVRYDARFSKN